MQIKVHSFTKEILRVLKEHFPGASEVLISSSPLLQYINIKTKAASKGSKSRPSLGNIYAVYVLVEDYLNGEFSNSNRYGAYEGAAYSDLFRRQRELPFGAKLQNHALNHRLNKEFEKYFPNIDVPPIIRDTASGRYWINERLLKPNIEDVSYNLAKPIIEIIDRYISARQSAFLEFMEDCKAIIATHETDPAKGQDFVRGLLRPNVDARVFEIVSFSIMKAFYADQHIFWGYQRDELRQEQLSLYKTGRTNANDGGIDFVMKPLGRFFQVTETTDVDKYFLDIDKVQRFPVTFIVKTQTDVTSLFAEIKANARKKYTIDLIVDEYMGCVEEIINIPVLMDCYEQTIVAGTFVDVIEEIVQQSKVEFNLAPV